MTDQLESKPQKEVEEERELRKLEDDIEYDYITVPPDGGFGWVVVIACFVSYFFKCFNRFFFYLPFYLADQFNY